MSSILEEIASDLAQRYITPYIERIERVGLAPSSPKEVHDPVWGTIALTPLDVAVIDSPIIQRLRHLKQLGVAHWVYPGANHSRFEHTLGVLHQTEQLITAINRSSLTTYNERVIGDEERGVLRLAALMHDIGHPFFSHVSEYALTLDAVALLAVQRQRQSIGEDVKLSEFIAACVVRSDEFKRLLKVIFNHHVQNGVRMHPWGARIDEFVEQVAKAILGQRISTQTPLLHEVISGPYDADKLDYMVRDSEAAGIPTIIDISRLLQKLTVRKLKNAELPKTIARNIPRDTPACYLFGFTWSGVSVVDELLLGRLILYAKVYRHSKVIALESMVRVLIGQMARLVEPSRLVKFLYQVCDEELLLADEQVLLKKLELKKSQVSNATKKRALHVSLDILNRLRERDLFVRAFAFVPLDRAKPVVADTKDPFAILTLRLNNRARCEDMRKAIVSETRSIMELLIPNARDSDHYVHADEMISIARVKPPSQEELRRAYVFPSSGTPDTFGDTGIHKDAWSSSFLSAAPKGFIFCQREIAPYVFIGTEVVIAQEFGVGVLDWMREESRQSKAQIEGMKRQLRERGYYSEKHRSCRPLSERLFMADVDNEIEQFAERFRVVEESIVDAVGSTQDGILDIRQRALEWLDQFEDEEFMDCGLELLKRARLLGRSDVVKGVRDFIKANPAFSSASVVPLSSGNDSSQIVQYYAADVSSDFRFYSSLADATAGNRNEPIIFLDDFVGTGNQISNTLGSWFGSSKLMRPELNEQRELKLQPDQDFLRSRKVALVFAAGWQVDLDI